MNYLRMLSLLFLFVGLAGCDSTTDPQPDDETAPGVYILNEGAFQAGNAELSYYDPVSGTVEGNLYTRSNDGATLGDVANHMVADGDRLLIVVNNSRRIEVIDRTTRRSVGRIATVGLPRRICVLPGDRAYVSMQDSTVSIIDLKALVVTGSITVGAYPEDVVASGEHAFVMNSGFGSGESISVIHIGSDSVVARIATPSGPQYGHVAGDGTVFVVCSGSFDFGNPSNERPGAILAVDPISFIVVDSLQVDGHPGKFVLGPDGTLYLLGPGAYPSTPVQTYATSPSLRLLDGALVEGAFYGIGIHHERGELYLSEAGDFVTNGRVLVHRFDGVAVVTLESGIGIAPNSFVVAGQ